MLAGHADHRAFGHLGMLQQHALDVARIDVEAAGDDHVLLAVAENDETVRIQPTHVTAADVAPAFAVEPLGLARFLGQTVVAIHHAGRSAHDLALLAGRQLAPLLVDEADVGALAGAAHGVQLVGVVVAVQLAAYAALGHPVVLDEPARPALQYFGLEGGTKRRAGAELVLQ